MPGLKVGEVRIVTKGDYLGMPFVIRELYVGEGGVPKAKMVSFFEGGPSGSVTVEDLLSSTRARVK
jgi:hypothetical protein